MSGDNNFQQIWNFRSKDDDIDSSSDDSKSSSKGEPKHDLASALFFVGNDEISDDPGPEKIDQDQPGEGAPPRKSRPKKQPITKARGKKSKTERKTDTPKARVKKSKTEKKTERGSKKEVGKKKRKSSVLNPDLLDELKIFTESILQDLRVKREQMFAQMKVDMQRLVSVESNTRLTKPKSRKRTGQVWHAKSTQTQSDMRPCNCSDGTVGRSIVNNWVPDSNNCSNALEERVFCDQAVQNIGSNKMEKGEHMGSLAKQSMYAFDQSDQFAASSYMALPSPPSGKLLEQQNTESPFRNSNNTVLACDRRNLMINGTNHSGYISGAQVEVPFPNFAQMGTKYMRFNDQHCTQTSSMRNGFPLPVHQRLEDSFNIPSQIDNFSGGNNIIAWRINGGTIGISGNGHTFSDKIAAIPANNVRNRMHYQANEEVTRYGIQDLRDGDFN
ncbi:hypothetical protein POM88_028494 [Heracleum sosnowskyi]|uniref:Uncharacterized protein n=1 Tax=Heracleum sosnowskyi TaxID=360622 RepID=A0AAD8MGC6_9APIA|nr:hypothetical protein POM88_028494 [Heracleum sosnowskyi]